MSGGRLQSNNRGDQHDPQSLYNQTPQQQQQQHYLQHQLYQHQLANLNPRWPNHQLGSAPLGYAPAPVPVPAAVAPNSHYTHLPQPPQYQAVSNEDRMWNALELGIRTLPTRDWGLSDFVEHEGRVLSFLNAFGLAVGTVVWRQRLEAFQHIVRIYPLGSPEDVYMGSYALYCQAKKITPFPIQPFAVASFLRSINPYDRPAVVDALDQISTQTSPLFDNLGSMPGTAAALNLSQTAWQLWGHFWYNARGSLRKWRMITQQLTVNPTPPLQSTSHQPPQSHQSLQPPQQHNTQPIHHPIPTKTTQALPSPAPAQVTASVPTGVVVPVAGPSRKRAAPRRAMAEDDAEAEKEDEVFYSEIDQLKAVMFRLALRRKQRHDALRTTTSSARSAFKPIPRSTSAPPRPPAASSRPTSAAGVEVSAFKSAPVPTGRPWADFTPAALPIEPTFTIPTCYIKPASPGRRILFTPASVPGSSGIPPMKMERDRRGLWDPKLSDGRTFESVQASLTEATGARVGLGQPSVLQRTIANYVSRPPASRTASNAATVAPPPAPNSASAIRRPSIAPEPHPGHKSAPVHHPSALGVTGLPNLQSSSINRPNVGPASRPSASSGMARTGSSGTAHSGRTPSLSGHSIHPLARLYGQISHQERKGVLQMVASRSPSCSQENSPRTGPPASLGASPLVKYVEMGIEIAQAAVKERQGQGLGKDKLAAMAAVAAVRTKGQASMDGLVAPPLVPLPGGSTPGTSLTVAPLPDPVLPVPQPRPSPVKSVPLLRPESAEPESEPDSPPVLLKYALPSTPSASPPPLTKVNVWSHSGFPSRPTDAIKRAGSVATRGVKCGGEGKKGVKDLAGWVQRANRPPMPFKVADQ